MGGGGEGGGGGGVRGWRGGGCLTNLTHEVKPMQFFSIDSLQTVPGHKVIKAFLHKNLIQDRRLAEVFAEFFQNSAVKNFSGHVFYIFFYCGIPTVFCTRLIVG